MYDRLEVLQIEPGHDEGGLICGVWIR